MLVSPLNLNAQTQIPNGQSRMISSEILEFNYGVAVLKEQLQGAMKPAQPLCVSDKPLHGEIKLLGMAN
jgi:hypothetical protein